MILQLDSPKNFHQMFQVILPTSLLCSLKSGISLINSSSINNYIMIMANKIISKHILCQKHQQEDDVYYENTDPSIQIK